MSYHDIEWPETTMDTISSTPQESISQETENINISSFQPSTVIGSTMSTIQNTIQAITQVTTQAVTKTTEIVRSTREALTTITPISKSVVTSTSNGPIRTVKIVETNASIQNTTPTIITTTEVSTTFEDVITSDSDTTQQVSTTTETILGQIYTFSVDQPNNTESGDLENDLQVDNDLTVYIIVATLLLVTFLLILGLSLMYRKHKRGIHVHESYNVRVSELNEYSPSPIKSDPESCKM